MPSPVHRPAALSVREAQWDEKHSRLDLWTEVGGGGSSQPDSTHTPTGGQPATLSSATVDWLEKEEAMAVSSLLASILPGRHA